MINTLQTLLEQGTEIGFSAVETFGETIEKHEYECFPDEPPSLHSVDTQRVTVRAFWETGDPVGFSLSKPEPDSIKSAFSNIYTTHLPGEKENYRHGLPAEVKKTTLHIFDESIDSVDVHAFNEFIDGINEIMIASLFQGLKLNKIHLSKALKKTYIANTNGLNIKYRKTNFNLVLSFALRNNHIDTSETRVFFRQLEPHKIISRAFNLLNSLTETSISADRHMSLILSPEASAFILREFSSCFKIKADREMMKIHYPSILNIIDNPLMDGQVGSVPFDDEGVQSGEKYLLQKGVFSTFISDLAAAFQHNTTSTGNGFRSERSPLPAVGFSNLYIKPTVLPLKNLMADAGVGVLVSLLKLKSIDNKGYVFSVYGYRFKDDELLEPVHFYFRTSFRSYFLKILKISKEVKFFYSSANIGSPYVLLEARYNRSDNLFEI
ncbi:MAG: hypothetical protein JSV88_10230 [Candidatus Aminicenantes bacterium]|nr:MAG: hypothetical protein JSV88_10230 [Candidatus Aminicenantes bacterium]